MDNYNGLRWYKTDLHLHTTNSKCFEDKTVTPEQWVEKCIEQGLSCVAVTDHNSGDGIDAIKVAAEGRLIVFPGVEVTSVVTKQHVLVLFDPDKGSSYVNEFLAKLDIFEDERGSEEAYTKMDIFDIAKIAKERNGITIAAHIDQFSGAESLGYQANVNLINDPNILGVQVVHDFLYENVIDTSKLQAKFDRIYNDVTEIIWSKWLTVAEFYKEQPIAKLTFSDNPAAEKSSKHGLYGIGKNFTWIKMSKIVTIETLKQALLLPNSRVVNNFSEKEPKFTPKTNIRKLVLENTIYNSTEQDIIYFSPQLTSIIGGRGTGKSSILRILRAVLNLENELEIYPDLFKEQTDYCKVNDGENGIFKPESIVKLYIESYGSHFEIIMKFKDNKKVYDLNIYFKDGTIQNVLPDEINNVLEGININIFSQKQIYEISKNPSALRDFIDSNIVEVQELKENLELETSKYKTNNFRIHELEKKITNKPTLQIKLKELEIKKNTINISAIESTLNNDTMFKKEMAILEFKKSLLFEKQDRIIKAQKFTMDTIKTDIFRASYKEEINRIISTVDKDLDKLKTEFDGIILKLEILIEGFRNSVKQSEWYIDYTKNTSVFTELQSQTTNNVLQTISEYKTIEESITAINTDLEEIERLSIEQNDLIQKNIEIIENIKTIRGKIKKYREVFCIEVLKDNPLLQVDVRAYRDQQSFINIFRDLIGKSQSFDSDIQFIIDKIYQGDINKTLDHFKIVFKNDFNEKNNELGLSRLQKVLQQLQSAQINLVDLIFPEDEVLIKYKANSQAQFKPLSNASAGQKTSAILTLLLSFGEQPLLLDQPEDDLDNSLIYDLIVDRIIKTKNSRQIVIVTHNANIPVNGDSELINVMNSQKLELLPSNNGSIDDAEIKDSICNIMEGGPKAFELRAKKYNIKI